MISALDVVWIYDGMIRPTGFKMVVCIHPENGWYYRINTKSHWRPCVAIPLADHSFLDHDSFLECGDPLELDDYLIEEALEKTNGPIGRISSGLCAEIVAALAECRTLKARDQEEIRRALGQ